HFVKRTRLYRVLDHLFCADLIQCSFEFLLEGAKWFGSVYSIRLCLTIDFISDNKTWGSGDLVRLSILKILLDTVSEFTALVTAIELVYIKASFFSNGCQAFIGK